MAIVPFVFVVLYPVGLLLALRSMSAADAQELIAKIPTSAFPGTGELTVQGQAAYIATVYLFAGFFLIIPTMVAVVLAANSFAGEKERHTLEGVLYTPVSDTALVVGKILGAVLPAVVVSWVCFGVYTILVNLLGNPLVGHWYFPTLNWWVLMLLAGARRRRVRHRLRRLGLGPGQLVPVGQLDRRLRRAAADPARGRTGDRRDAPRAGPLRGDRRRPGGPRRAHDAVDHRHVRPREGRRVVPLAGATLLLGRGRALTRHGIPSLRPLTAGRAANSMPQWVSRAYVTSPPVGGDGQASNGVPPWEMTRAKPDAAG